MVDSDYRDPRHRIVAVLADIGGENMIRILACRCTSVVTSGATGSNGGVVEVRRYPGIGGMTIFAIVATDNVVRILTGRY